MIAQTPRDPWRTIWRVATSDHLVAVLLLGIAAGLTITAWLPQTPVDNPVTYAQWLSETQARFGDATSTLQVLGLFTITRSFGFRTLLALLAGILLLRLIESSDRLRQNREMVNPEREWHSLADVDLPDVMDELRRRRYRLLSEPPLFQADRWPWADLFPLLAHGGGLLLLIGLLVTHLWGWRVEGLIVQGDERITLPNTEAWIALDESARDVTHSPDIVALIEGQVPGVQARAADGTGQPLPLQKTPKTEPATQLTVPLTEDQYFAIPEALLIVRLAPQLNNAPDHITETNSSVLVQVYRIPSVRLVAETVVEREAELSVDDVTLELTSVPYARLTVVFNPGLWPTSVGLVLLVVGLLGSVAWPVRRFWLREGSEQIETTGDPLLMLARDWDA